MWAKKPDPEYKAEWFVVLGMVILGITVLFLSFNAKADYIYEANQSLYDLQTNTTGSTGLGSNDDAVSGAFNIGFTFDFYGQSFTQARMATNGCLHFKTSGAYCSDYTPDPLPEVTYTLYPFWTDLIKDNGSAMRAKAFNDYTIFGWYNMREYNRANSDNSFEVWLYPNNTYEFRYGELEIINHDVLIGEQGSASQTYTYLFHDECSTGTTNVAGTCVNTNWNNTASNTLLEGGGSLYGDGTNQSLCATTPLTSANCSGYAAAYLAQQCALNSLYNEDCTGYTAAFLTQQCNITQLYSQECPSYWSAYDDQQCEDDPQYSPSCAGYTQEASVAYYVEETDYGYTQDDMWYDEEYNEWLDSDDPCYENNCIDFTDADWYALDIEQFGQEQVDEWYGNDVEFSNDGFIEYGTVNEEDYWTAIDDGMDVYDLEQETTWAEEELYLVSYDEIEYDPLPFDTSEELIEDFILHETVLVEDYEDLDTYIEFESVEELDEWYEEELEQIEEERIEEELLAEEEITEEVEEVLEEEIFEEEVVEELFEEIEEERLAEAEEEILEEREERSGGITATQLSVVASTIQTASNSVSGTTARTSTRGSGWGSSTSGSSGSYNSSGGSVVSSTAGNTTTTAVASAASGGGFSTSSSPSISDQIQTAQVQTNTVLNLSQDMGSTSGTGGSTQTVSNVTTVITPMPIFDSNPQVVMADIQVTDMQGEIDTAVGGVMTASEADQIADQIVADNIKEQQEAGQTTQEETGEYGDQSTLVAFMGYVPGFDAYKEVQIPQQETWYEPKAIYADVSISDNIEAFYGLARTNINTMQSLINQQPNL